MSQKHVRALLPLILFSLAFGLPACAQESGPESVQKRFSIETSAIDPLFSIYFVRFHFLVGQQDELGLGAYFLYAEKTFSGVPYPGNYRGISMLLDYKRYLWNQLYLEYQAMPSYVLYSDSTGGTKGFELWNELHLGYMINFSIGKASCFVNPQTILGFCLYVTIQLV